MQRFRTGNFSFYLAVSFGYSVDVVFCLGKRIFFFILKNHCFSTDYNQLHSLYDLANVVPTLAKFYHQASEAYEQACTRHISMIIYYVSNPLLSLRLSKLTSIYVRVVSLRVIK